MKISNRKIISQAGNVMLITLIMCVIMGTTLASYLIMVNNQNLSVVRSQTWNSSIPVSEAGIEEGLAFINKYAGSSETNKLDDWAFSSSASADGWNTYTIDGKQVFRLARWMAGGIYDVWITNTPSGPSIRSIGYVNWNQGYQMVTPLAAASGINYVYQQWLSRHVVVETRKDAFWAVAMAAKQTIDFNGNNVTTDSFDSGDANYSNGGKYPLGQLGKTKDNGDVVTSYTIVNSLSVGNADIKGKIKTGPKGTATIGSNGSVGDRAWVEGGNSGIKPGWYSDDMNVVFPDVTLPATSWIPAVANNVTIDGKTYQYAFLNSGDYLISSFSSSMYVGTNVSVRLRITGNVSLTGNNDVIQLSPVGSSLKIYMQGASFKIKGNGIANATDDAINLQYFGLPSNTAVDFGGNASFTGSIYAPQAAFSLGGGGNDTYDFVGASVTLSVKMNGHFNFHYDEALRNSGPGRGYVPTSWREG
jgi:hypothetical protein